MPLPRAVPFSVDLGRPLSGDHEGFESGTFLKPIIAGARARGVADGFEMMGVGAVLIDPTGRVLHAGGRARRMIGGFARIVGDHLIAERTVDTAAFETLIEQAVGTGPHDAEARVVLADMAGLLRLSLRAIRFASGADEAQCLRAVLVLEEVAAG